MAISLRPSSGKNMRFYAPERDLAHLAPELIREALGTLTNPDSFFVRWFKSHPHKDEEMGLAAQAIAKYINACTKEKDVTVEHLMWELEKDFMLAGGDNTKILMYSIIGQALLTSFYTCIRDVANEDGQDKYDIDRFTKTTSWVVDYMSWSPFRKWLVQAWRKFRRYLNPEAVENLLPVIIRPDELKNNPEILKIEHWIEVEGKHHHVVFCLKDGKISEVAVDGVIGNKVKPVEEEKDDGREQEV